MKNAIIFLLTIISSDVFAQLAVIEDKDGYVNIRKEPNSSGVIVGKLTEKDIFWCFEEGNDWYPIDTEATDNNAISGYVHKSRIKFLTDYDSIPLTEPDINSVHFSGKDIEVDLKTKAFDKKSHHIDFNNYNYVDKIDNKKIWGTDGDIPKREYEQVVILYANKKIELPKSALENLFEPNLNFTDVYYNKEKDILYITGLNSDGAGAYVFAWIISQKEYIGRVTLMPF